MERANKVMYLMETKLSESKQDVLSDMLSFIHPIIGFFSKFSSAKYCPGDKIDDELNSIKSSLRWCYPRDYA